MAGKGKGKGKVFRFWRGARQDPKWDLGTPPSLRARKPRPPRRRRWGGWLVAGALAVMLFGPVALDAASLAWRDSTGCRVWMVIDGDTVRMVCPGPGNVKGRLVGFDTPEMKARCPKELGLAVAATYYLRWQIWTARDVVATPRAQDRYDRTLTLMAVDDELIGTRMVRAGLARWYDGGPRKGWCGGVE